MTKNETFFVDIDGTLIKYRKFEELESIKPIPIQSVVDKINTEYDKGSYIVITSARPESFRKLTENELEVCGIKYNVLLLGVGRGVRTVINDVSPSDPTKNKAVGINLIRDKGFY